MNPMLMSQLQQLWMAGMGVGQQAVTLEMSGNAAAAAQAYAQSAEQLRVSVMLATSNGVFVPDGIHATLATAHMGAARARVAMGQVLDASPHFQLALHALNQAIALNPNVPAWHSAAGAVLLALGNLGDAERAFATVQKMLPGEPTSRAMLEQLGTMRQAQSGWGVQLAPTPPSFGPAAPFNAGANLGSAAQRDWAKMVKDVCGTLDSIMGTMSKFNDISRGFN
jgi:tetratricopeptide (TPR) repeat protein